MRDIEIKINRETRKVRLSKRIIGNDGENLQGNLVFSFTDEFVNGTARLELIIDKATYIMLDKNDDTYQIPIKSLLTKEGTISMQLVINEGANIDEVPIFKSDVFEIECRESINAQIEQPEEYTQWIDIANAKLNLMEITIQDAEDKANFALEQGNNAKAISDTLSTKLDNGDFNGATFTPNVDEDGNLSWSNNKGLVNPNTQNIRGPQGVMGPQGEAFAIKKTYSSKDAMLADFNNMVFGDYVMITSNTELEDNAKLYSRGESEWVFITDFSGATGIQGPQGVQGIQGIQGEKGDKGDKPVRGVDYFTQSDIDSMVNTITQNANSEFNMNVDGKTNEFNANAELKTQEFNDNVDSLQDEMNDLYNNQLFNEVEGTSINITDSANIKIDNLIIDGNSLKNEEEKEIVNVTGIVNFLKFNNINEFTKDGVICSVNNDIITLNGQSSVDYANDILTTNEVNLKAKKDEYYTLSYHVLNGSKNVKLGISFRDANNTQLDYIQDINSTDLSVSKLISAETINNTKYIVFFVRTKEKLENLQMNIQLEKGSVAHSYVSANTSWLKIEFIGKNILDNTDYSLGNISNAGSDEISTSTYRFNKYIPVMDGKKIYLSDNLCAYYYDKDFKFISYDWSGYLTLDTPTNARYVRFRTFAADFDTFDAKICMVSYEPIKKYEDYKIQECIVDLKDNELCSIGDIREILEIKDGKILLTKKIGKIVLDGSENWEYAETYNYFRCPTFNFNGKIPNQNSNQICTHFEIITDWGDSFRDKVNTNGMFTVADTGYKVCVRNTSCSNVEEFVTWLKNNNVEVYYELAQPYEIEFGPIEMPKTYKSITNINLSTNLDTLMHLKYVQSTEQVINDLKSQISLILSNNEG